MKDAFDDLERDLRAAVRARRRPRLRRTPMLALAAALALGGGGALAATQIKSSPKDDRAGAKLARSAVVDTYHSPACRRPTKPDRRHVVGDGPVLPSIARLLPSLTHPPAKGAAGSLSDFHYGSGTLLRSTARVVTLAGGLRLTVFVIQGPDLFGPADPAACTKARLARVDKLAAHRSAAVRAAAEREVSRQRDTAPGLQTLWLQLSLGKRRGGFGTGVRLRPDDPIGPGIVASGSSGSSGIDGGRRYVGIADPRTVQLLVDPAHGHSKTVRVHENLYSFALPKGSGHVDLREVDAAGATVRSFPLRG
jgi:hypothetical protein